MVEVAQELHLSESSQAKHGVVEGSNFLDGDLLARGLVYRRAVARTPLVGAVLAF